MKIELRQLSLVDADTVYQMFQDMPASENGVENKAHGLTKSEFLEWTQKRLDSANGIGLRPGYVPDTTYILWIDNAPVGVGKLRHFLTEKLEQDGGHIGIQLSPKYRGLGYGNILITEMLKAAKQMGIKRALVFNHDDNVPAWKLSERAGGKLESITQKPDTGIKLRKYWINLGE